MTHDFDAIAKRLNYSPLYILNMMYEHWTYTAPLHDQELADSKIAKEFPEAYNAALAKRENNKRLERQRIQQRSDDILFGRVKP